MMINKVVLIKRISELISFYELVKTIEFVDGMKLVRDFICGYPLSKCSQESSNKKDTAVNVCDDGVKPSSCNPVFIKVLDYLSKQNTEESGILYQEFGKEVIKEVDSHNVMSGVNNLIGDTNNQQGLGGSRSDIGSKIKVNTTESSEVPAGYHNKPKFYLMDLDNYNDDFLKEIILWQSKEIERLSYCNDCKYLYADWCHKPSRCEDDSQVVKLLTF